MLWPGISLELAPELTFTGDRRGNKIFVPLTRRFPLVAVVEVLGDIVTLACCVRPAVHGCRAGAGKGPPPPLPFVLLKS